MVIAGEMPSLSEVDIRDIVSPERTARSRPHEVYAALRRESPVHWCEIDGFTPFWAVTRHADVRYISTHPELFSSTGRLILQTAEVDAMEHPMVNVRNVLNTDPPDHKAFRDMVGPYFRPRPLRNLEERVREISRQLLDQYTNPGGGDVELDFTASIATWHPLKMLAQLLGASEDDEGVILKVANETFGADDPEFAARSREEVLTEMLTFLTGLIGQKRAHPDEDIATVLTQATFHGEPVSDIDLASYLGVLITAGHDTTRNALSAGMAALIDNPDQLLLLQQDLSLIPSATEEMVRWATPVMQFMRTATQDCEVGGQAIAKGETLAMLFASANFDESVFDDPLEFRVDRDPNPHLAFGVGEHYCIGAALARMEIRVMLEELLPRLVRVESAGERFNLASIFVSGVKHLPIRWQLRPASLA